MKGWSVRVLNLVPLSWLNVYHFSYLAALTKGNLKLKVLMKYFQGATRRAFENMSASHSCNFGCNFVDIHIYISTFYQWCNFVDIYISTFTGWAILSIHTYISTFTGGAIFSIYIDTCQTLTGGAILSIYISTFTGDLFWFVGLVGHKILFRSHYRREDSFTLPSPYPWCDVWTTE
jgi:hypothetical protein